MTGFFGASQVVHALCQFLCSDRRTVSQCQLHSYARGDSGEWHDFCVAGRDECGLLC